MTDKLTCGACEEKLLALLEAMEAGGDDCVCDDFGLWETLCADMLTEEETERLAEHLDVCEDCRQECADAHKLRAYEGTPFYARMDAYRENPAAESDENWKKIAFAFDASLAKIVVPGEGTILKFDASTPSRKVDNVDNVNALSRWRVPAYSAAAAVFFAAALTAGPSMVETARKIWNPQPTPIIVNPVLPADSPNALPSDDEPETLENASDNDGMNLNGSKGLGDETVSSVYGETPEGNADLQSGTIADLESGAEENASLSELFENSQVKELKPNEGAKAMELEGEAMCAEEGLTLLTLDDLALNLSMDCQAAVDSFNDGDFETAAKGFGALVETLKASEEVDAEALNRAYWNWGVATLRSDNKEKAKEIFETLKARKPGDEMSAMADAALEECQN